MNQVRIGFVLAMVASLSVRASGTTVPEQPLTLQPAVGVEHPAEAVSEYRTIRPPTPWIHSAMPEDDRARLEAGFSLAVRRLEERPECRALFEELGADPFAALANILYFPVTSHFNAKRVCKGRAAYSFVGGTSVFLCRSFSRRTDRRAAVCVIHEALHSAGLDECPHLPAAQRSRDINRMIIFACGLE